MSTMNTDDPMAGKYQLIDEGDDHFMLKHPDGSEFAVAKAHTPQEHQDEIRNLPRVKSADPWGGDVTYASAAQAPAMPAQQPGPMPSPMPDYEAALGSIPQAPVSAPEMANYGASFNQHFGQIAAGIQGAADAQAQGYQEQALAQDAYMNRLEEEQRRYMDERKRLDGESATLEKDVADSKIDPQRWWKEQSGGQRVGNHILAFIGMILGGPMQLRTGVNPMQHALDKIINDDIEAQKANLDKKQSLYRMNLEKYRNADAAHTATSLAMHNMVGAQLAKIAATTQSEAIRSQAQQALGELGLKKDELKHQRAMEHAAAQAQQILQGEVPLEAVPAEMRPLMVPTPTGGWTMAVSKEDAGELRKAAGTIGTIKDTIARARELRKKGGFGAFGDVPIIRTGTEHGEHGVRIEKELIDQLRQLGANLRLGEGTMDHLTALAVNPTQWGWTKNVESNLNDLEAYVDRIYSNQLSSRSAQGGFKQANAKFER